MTAIAVISSPYGVVKYYIFVYNTLSKHLNASAQKDPVHDRRGTQALEIASEDPQAIAQRSSIRKPEHFFLPARRITYLSWPRLCLLPSPTSAPTVHGFVLFRFSRLPPGCRQLRDLWSLQLLPLRVRLSPWLIHGRRGRMPR